MPMAVLTRALIGISLAATLLVPARAAAAESSPASLAVIGFELDDDHPDPVRARQLRDRLTAIQKQLEKGLHDRGLYRVVDTAAAKDLIDALYERHSFVYRCNACFVEVGQRLDTRLVAVGWVQRVSELILNVNVSVRDASTDTEILSKSVDLRGNTDETWRRAMNFMLRDWAERRARNPDYGQ